MVHALREVWRILRPFGIVVDLRPICVDVPVLILTNIGWKSAGLADQSQYKVDDIAANQAMRTVVHNGLFIRLKQEYFNTNYYWNNLKELKVTVDTRWKDGITIPKEIWRLARLLFKDGSGQRRVRIPFRNKLTVYQKTG